MFTCTKCGHQTDTGGLPACPGCGAGPETPDRSWRSQRRIASVVVPKRPNEFGEWVVRAYDQHGERWPECDYFTSDRDDACLTAVRMVADAPNL